MPAVKFGLISADLDLAHPQMCSKPLLVMFGCIFWSYRQKGWKLSKLLSSVNDETSSRGDRRGRREGEDPPVPSWARGDVRIRDVMLTTIYPKYYLTHPYTIRTSAKNTIYRVLEKGNPPTHLIIHNGAIVPGWQHTIQIYRYTLL